jgi:hypothetical protein
MRMTPESIETAVQTVIEILQNSRNLLINPEQRTQTQLLWTVCVLDKQLSIALDVLKDFRDETRK